MLEAIAESLKPGSKCLDIGSGSGYITVCMAIMVKGANENYLKKIIYDLQLYNFGLVYFTLEKLNYSYYIYRCTHV